MSIFSKPISKLTVMVAVFAVTLGISLVPATAHAGLFDGAKDEACRGAALSSDATVTCDTAAADKKIDSVLETALNLLSIIVAVISVIVIILGGLRFILAQGDSNSIASARNSVLYALVGLVIVAMAQIMVRFVIGRVDGAPASAPTAPALNGPGRNGSHVE